MRLQHHVLSHESKPLYNNLQTMLEHQKQPVWCNGAALPAHPGDEQHDLGGPYATPAWGGPGSCPGTGILFFRFLPFYFLLFTIMLQVPI